METTLALIKPDGVAAGLVGEIIARFERAGLRPVALRLLEAPRPVAEQHYGEEIARKHGDEIRRVLLDYLTDGPLVAVLLTGPEAVRTARELAGEAPCPTRCAPGTIRADLAADTLEAANAAGRALHNLIHTSDSPEAAQREAALWFADPCASLPA